MSTVDFDGALEAVSYAYFGAGVGECVRVYTCVVVHVVLAVIMFHTTGQTGYDVQCMVTTHKLLSAATMAEVNTTVAIQDAESLLVSGPLFQQRYYRPG